MSAYPARSETAFGRAHRRRNERPLCERGYPAGLQAEGHGMTMEKACANCNGTGIVPASEWDSDKAMRPNYERRAERCPKCNGTGSAPSTHEAGA